MTAIKVAGRGPGGGVGSFHIKAANYSLHPAG